ncbi:MAG: hypothetical protein RIR96_74, partial [Bacteroidota bacterium]
MIVLILLLVSLYGLIQLPNVQTWLVGKVANTLSNKLGAEVSISRVDLSFFHSIEFEKLLIRDKTGDTLVFAGKASADATNWFFLKKHFTIKDVQLEDGVLKMKRDSKTWNYQFLLDYFKGDTLQKSKSDLSFDLNKIRLRHFRISSTDDWIGESMKIGVDDLFVKIKKTDIDKGNIEIENIDAKNPYFSLWNYDGKRTSEEEKQSNLSKTQKGTSNPFHVKISKFNIVNGSFFSDEPTERSIYADKFDELHIRFTDINASLTGISITPDALKAHLTMNAKERCGFKLNKLESDVLIDSSMMEFKKLSIITDKSKVGDYYAMKYRSFKDDMNDFLNRVEVVGRLTKSKVHSDDIAFFAPELKDWKREFDMIGKTTGTLNRFEIRDMIVKSNNTLVQGDLSLRDIDDLDNMFLIFNSTGSLTNFKEISSFAPMISALKKEELQRLGNIYYKGNFTGFFTDFVAKGDVRTDIGSLATDLKFNLNDKGIASYQGDLKTDQFDLGKLMNETSVGKISLKGKVQGQGFTLKTVKTSFSGIVSAIDFNGYNYKNVDITGTFDKNNFIGNLSISDSNLSIRSLKGKVLFEADNVTVNLNADLEKANLKAIRLLNKEIGFSGKVDMNFSGSDIDHVIGDAIIHSGSLTHNNKTLPFTGLSVSASKVDDQKSISLKSDVLEASITGQYSMSELPDAFKLFLHNYYPSYIPKPNLNLSNQAFSFLLKTENIDEIMQVILPDWEGGNHAKIEGGLNLSKNEFNIDADVPYFRYKNNELRNTSIQGNGNLDTLYVAAKVEDYYSSDSLHLTNTSIELKSKDDVSLIQLHSGQEGTLNEANVHASVQTFSDGFNLQFMPSSLVLNGKKWDIRKDGTFSIHGKLVQAQDISFSHNEESISLSSELDELGDHSNLKANLTQVKSADFMPLFFREPEVKGTISGTISINDPLGKQNVDFNAQVDSLSIEKELIGKVSINGIAQPKEGQLNFNAHSMDTTNDFDIKGGYTFGETSSNTFLANLKGKKINISILRPYLNDVFDEMDGTATTDLTLTYGKNAEYLTGQVMVNKATLKVGYTQVRYFIENQPIVFKEDEIAFNLLLLKDSLGNSAAMGGRIYHRFFDDFEFRNLRIESSKLSLLNTTKKDNPQFYGQAIGRAKMNIFGPLNNLRIQIDAEPMTLDSSHIYLSTSE